jgi:hypothetical protein
VLRPEPLLAMVIFGSIAGPADNHHALEFRAHRLEVAHFVHRAATGNTYRVGQLAEKLGRIEALRGDRFRLAGREPKPSLPAKTHHAFAEITGRRNDVDGVPGYRSGDTTREPVTNLDLPCRTLRQPTALEPPAMVEAMYCVLMMFRRT